MLNKKEIVAMLDLTQQNYLELPTGLAQSVEPFCTGDVYYVGTFQISVVFIFYHVDLPNQCIGTV